MGQNINQNIRFRSSNQQKLNYEKLKEGIKKGDILSISRAITLVENKNLNYESEVLAFLSNLKTDQESLRIAVTGTPGVGKSTFIESLGLEFLSRGLKVAVLAIDPASELNRGSILGDKTRMPKLSNAEGAFVRPSSNSLELGGIRTSTYDSIKICEAAGYDIILIETVGVGQSEIDVSKISDLLILLIAPAGGDELQGIKKGIVEMADFILINKADSGLEKLAEQAQKDYQSAVHFSTGKKSLLGELEIRTISSLQGKGITQVSDKLIGIKNNAQLYTKIQNKRSTQDKSWYKAKAEQLLLHLIKKNPNVIQAYNKVDENNDLYQKLLKLSAYYSKII